MENLQRHTVSGLRHICDLLGAPESEDDTHVADMVRTSQRLTRIYKYICRVVFLSSTVGSGGTTLLHPTKRIKLVPNTCLLTPA